MPMPQRALKLAALCVVLILAGCQRKGIEDLLGNDLFTISLGKLEDQIDLFQFEGAMTEKTNSVYMRDGWFYVANGSAGKIMVFSSYGDLIYLLYNPQKNPAPTTLGPLDETSGDEASTRGAVAYPFASIGKIAVASDRTLYVEDTVAEAKAVQDPGLRRTQIVLRFDRRGHPLGSIGEEGVGGSPFPFIWALHVTAKDQLVVVCRLPDYSWEVYWYDRDGAPLYQVQIGLDNLPVKDQKGETSSLVDLIPDPDSPLLYALLYTWQASSTTRTPSSSNAASAENLATRVYKLDLRTRQYNPSYVELPQNPPLKAKSGLQGTIPAPPSDLLGIGSGGYYYLLAYTDTNVYTLQVLDASGTVRARRRLAIEDSTLTFRDLHLSSSGIIYGLFSDQDKAWISWWRSDLALKGE